MPAKKDPKIEEPPYVDEDGTFIHEHEGARYSGGVRRYNAPSESTAAATSGKGGHGGTKGSSSAAHVGVGQEDQDPLDATANAMRQRHGHGTYISGMIRYIGDWCEDQMHGKGHLEFLSSGSTYDGDFTHGSFEGVGVYCWKDGSRYEGCWRCNRMHGDGVYTDADGHIWKGKYYNGTGPGLKELYSNFTNVPV